MSNTLIWNGIYCIVFALFGISIYIFYYKRSKDKINWV